MGGRGVLRTQEGHRLAFWCPGCREQHAVTVAPHPQPWGFNGNFDAPTFTPSVLIRSGHYVRGGEPGDDCWCTDERRFGKPAPFHCRVCHSFVTDGSIQFLGDCTHELKGQTVKLQPFGDPA